MSRTDPDHDTLDALVDAIETAELLTWIGWWLAQAPPAVAADFERWAWPYTLAELRADLLATADRLVPGWIEAQEQP